MSISCMCTMDNGQIDCKNRLELLMHYDGNRGASINLLKVNLLQEDVIIRDFFLLVFWTTM